MKIQNTSYLTDETIAYYNDLIRKLFNIEPSNISQIETDILYQLLNGWCGTKLSTKSFVNNVNTLDFQIFLEHLKNDRNFKTTFGSTISKTDSDLNKVDVFINLNERRTNLVNDDSSIELAARNEIRIPVPEGYDGNMAFVEFLVPKQVLETITTTDYLVGWGTDGDVVPTFGVPDGNSFNVWDTGVYRRNALFFYSHFTKGNVSAGDNNTGRLKIVANKFADEIIIEYSACDFVKPFERDDSNSVDPLVLVRTTMIKRGVR